MLKKLNVLLVVMLVANTLFATPVLHTRQAAIKTKTLQFATSAERQKVQKQLAETADKAIAPAATTIAPSTTTKALAVVNKVPAQKTAKEEIVLHYDKFAYFQYYASSKDWFLSMSCDDPSKPEYGYVVKFDYFAPADNPFGTFTTSDFDMTYSLIGINKEVMVFYEEVTLTVSQVKTGNMSTIIAEATILGDDGNTYKVKCVEETISPATQHKVVINNATLTKTDKQFTIAGQNNSMEATLVVNNAKSVLGSYAQSSIDLDACQFTYREAVVTPMQVSAEVTSATVNGKLSYVANISMLSTDTVQYDITMNVPLPEPTKKVDIVAKNLLVDDSYVDWYGKIFADAYTSLWLVDLEIPGYYLTEGTYSEGVVCTIINRFTDEEITALQATLQVSKDKNGRWVIAGEVRGSDNVLYNLHLSWTVPTPSKVVKVRFDESAEATYWVQDNDLQLSNLTDDYYVSLDAANDYGTPIHIVYNGSLVESGVEQLVAEQVVAKKILNNGQLLIIHDNGDVFDTTGARVK